MTTSSAPRDHAPQLDAVVIGAGFSGLYLLHKLRNEMGLSVRVLEAGGDIGGTWYWNRYPGARCDSESYVYCYSFDEKMWQEWEWSERYPQQAEVLSYFDYVAERLDLRRDITFDTRVAAATFDEADGTWTVRTESGEEISARYLITGVGCLSAWNTPPFPGLEDFAGETYFTGLWPHEPVDLAGKRVAVIGTGASGVQTIPRIAEVASDLTVFQRTPNYIIPARHGKVPPELVAERKQDFAGVWERTRNGAFGLPFQPHHKPMAECTDDEIDAVMEEWWQTGGSRLHAGLLPRGDLQHRCEQAARRVPGPQDRGEGPRPGGRRPAHPEEAHLRRQTAPAGLRVLRGLQLPARASGRRQHQRDRRRHHRRPAIDRRHRVRLRRDRLRDRLRRHHRDPEPDRHPRAGTDNCCGRSGRRAHAPTWA